MSRSYKKHYRAKDSSNKNMKRFANKKVRRNQNLLPSKGRSFKKLFESWEISDWNWPWTREDAIASWYEEEADHYKGVTWRHNNFGTLEKWLNYWEKCVKRK